MLLIAGSSSALAASVSVPSGPYPTLAAALADTAVTAVDVSADQDLVDVGRPVTIRCANGVELAVSDDDGAELLAPGIVLDGCAIVRSTGSAGRLLRVAADASLVGGSVVGGSSAKGGAIELTAGTLTVAGTVLSGHRSTGDGGAIACGENAALVLEGAVFTDDRAEGRGGAVFAQDCAVTSTGSTFELGSAWLGGALALSQASLDSTDDRWDSNTADDIGGAVWADTTGVVELDGAVIRRSVAARAAVGVYHGQLTVRDARLCDNASTYPGGAVYVEHPSVPVIVERSLFLRNASGDWGGAVRVFRGGIAVRASTFVENQATVDQGDAEVAAAAIAIETDAPGDPAEVVDSLTFAHSVGEAVLWLRTDHGVDWVLGASATRSDVAPVVVGGTGTLRALTADPFALPPPDTCDWLPVTTAEAAGLGPPEPADPHTGATTADTGPTDGDADADSDSDSDTDADSDADSDAAPDTGPAAVAGDPGCGCGHAAPSGGWLALLALLRRRR